MPKTAHHLLIPLAALALFASSPAAPATTIPEMLSMVSEAQYRAYQEAIEDCGLGLYAGPAYDNGSRSRKWHQPPPPNLGNMEAQIYMRDMFAANPRLIVTSPYGYQQNIVAELPGVDPVRKNEVYIISGHMDTTGDYNRPGGDDNSSGAAGVLEAARVMSQLYFGATIQFIGFNGEEGAHYGSLEYVNDLSPEQRELIKGVINLDMIIHPRHDGNPSAAWDIDLWTDTTQPKQVAWMDTFTAAAGQYVPALAVDPTYDNRASSDHQSFYQVGIPAFTCIEFSVSEWQSGANAEYHTARDFRFYEPNGAGNGYLKDLHWSYPFAVNVVKATMATIAQEAGLSPPIFNVRVTDIERDAVTIRWSTSQAASSRVEYGLDQGYGQSTAEDPTPVTEHVVNLTGLTPGTLYHFRAASTAGETSYSPDHTFRTLKVPSISNVQIKSLGPVSAIIAWDTDVVSDTQIEYGLTTDYGASTTPDPEPVLTHTQTLTGLLPDTTYHFRVCSGNSEGASVSGDHLFRTLAGVDDIIIDNLDPGFSISLGTWTSGAAAGVPKWGDNYLFASGTGSSSTTTARCQWSTLVPMTGLYDVYAFYQKGTNRNSAAPFVITYTDGQTTSVQNQYASAPEGEWYLLAAGLPYDAGNSAVVQLSNNSTDTNYVSADAVKIVYSGPPPDFTPPSIPANLSALVTSHNQLEVRWLPSTDNVAVAGYRVQTASGTDTVINPVYVAAGLNPNTEYAYRVSAFDVSGNESGQSPEIKATTKSLPPSSSNVLYVPAANEWHSTSGVTFTASGGFGPGTVEFYRYAWNALPSYTFAGTEASWFDGQLALPEQQGEPRYLHLRGWNSAGVPNGTYIAGPFLYDGTPPEAPVVSLDRKYAAAGDVLNASWESTDAESGVSVSEFRVLDPVGQEISPWQPAGSSSAEIEMDDSTETSRVEVRVQNAAGAWSSTGLSPAVQLADLTESPGAARSIGEGVPVIVRPVVLTKVLESESFVQELNGYSAIQVQSLTQLPVGSLVSAGGMLSIIEGLPRLSDGELLALSGNAVVRPVLLSARAIAGSASTELVQMEGAVGPYNMATMVALVGRVTRSQPGEGFFYLLDASGRTGPEGLGVRVATAGQPKPDAGQLVYVSGVAWAERNGEGFVPVLLADQQASWRLLLP